MTTRKPDRGADARLVELEVADDAESWARVGFTTLDDVVTVDDVRIRLSGARGDRRGIVGWTVSGLIAHGDDIDGLPTTFVEAADPSGERPLHANGTHGLDHVVVVTPDLDRSIAALATVGLSCRRIRDTTSRQGTPMRQAFFKLGAVVVEVVAGGLGTIASDDVDDRGATVGPAAWFGLAFDVDDLEVTGALLDDGLGARRPAVQAGRRIATLRQRALDISVATAFMDDHGCQT